MPPLPKSPFLLARKPLRLVVDDVDESDPTDLAYVFSGYAPLSVRLVQCAIGKDVQGWKGIEEVVKALPGATFEDAQAGGAGLYSSGSCCFLASVRVSDGKSRTADGRGADDDRLLPRWSHLRRDRRDPLPQSPDSR